MIPIKSLEQVILGPRVLNQLKSKSFDPSCADNCRKAQNMVARSPRQQEIQNLGDEAGKSRTLCFAKPSQTS